jgi:hypothetical protein
MTEVATGIQWLLPSHVPLETSKFTHLTELSNTRGEAVQQIMRDVSSQISVHSFEGSGPQSIPLHHRRSSVQHYVSGLYGSPDAVQNGRKSQSAFQYIPPCDAFISEYLPNSSEFVTAENQIYNPLSNIDFDLPDSLQPPQVQNLEVPTVEPLPHQHQLPLHHQGKAENKSHEEESSSTEGWKSFETPQLGSSEPRSINATYMR